MKEAERAIIGTREAPAKHRSKTGLERLQAFSLLLALCPALASCSGSQSALDPAGEEASQVAILFWVMVAGGSMAWAIVVALSLYAARWKRKTISEQAAGRVILWGGAIFPAVVLTALLAYALWLMPSLRPFTRQENPDLRIEVVGHQFWWHVVYHRADGTQVISANEVRIPVGKRVEFALASADMIHSFWIPALGGKMDLVPGRVNRLSLLATRPGIYRGQCAEFCGTSHALMAFPALAMEVAEFEAWLDQRLLASAGISAAEAGRKAFLREGCGDCHRVDGTEARGASGPDLSHIGSRLTIGAGQLKNEDGNLARFISYSSSVKPGSHMPAYPKLSRDDLSSIAAWLGGLK
ncbi:cytochrome c oxidase subunit II [Rhizobium sp. LjRoot30]|uniref:cytochrome c oxidase subunit II n=1 Tax=Rhizobium sp. LjRoot30 TaxID=3342320 RepID=UPI003ECC7FB2